MDSVYLRPLNEAGFCSVRANTVQVLLSRDTVRLTIESLNYTECSSKGCFGLKLKAVGPAPYGPPTNGCTSPQDAQAKVFRRFAKLPAVKYEMKKAHRSRVYRLPESPALKCHLL